MDYFSYKYKLDQECSGFLSLWWDKSSVLLACIFDLKRMLTNLLLILSWCSELSDKPLRYYLWRVMSNSHMQRNTFQAFHAYRTGALLDLLFANCNPCHFINISEENPLVSFSEATCLFLFHYIKQKESCKLVLLLVISCRTLHKCKKAKPSTHYIKLLEYF